MKRNSRTRRASVRTLQKQIVILTSQLDAANLDAKHSKWALGKAQRASEEALNDGLSLFARNPERYADILNHMAIGMGRAMFEKHGLNAARLFNDGRWTGKDLNFGASAPWGTQSQVRIKMTMPQFDYWYQDEIGPDYRPTSDNGL